MAFSTLVPRLAWVILPCFATALFTAALFTLPFLAGPFLGGVLFAADPDPQFNSDKELLRPRDYRQWVFIGATLGMSYDENEEKRKQPKFHNLYINPAAYREYEQSGRFPEKTVIVMEVLTAKSQSSINRQGHFEDELLGVEVALKDSSRFAESWAYFSFIAEDGSQKETAGAFRKERCWSCHHEHAATDNVFTQFYPVLRRAR